MLEQGSSDGYVSLILETKYWPIDSHVSHDKTEDPCPLLLGTSLGPWPGRWLLRSTSPCSRFIPSCVAGLQIDKSLSRLTARLPLALRLRSTRARRCLARVRVPAEAMDAFTPQQTIELVSRIGCKKTHMRWDKLFWNSFMAGPLLGFG